MLRNERLYDIYLLGAKPATAGQLQGAKPDFRGRVVSIDMDVRRLVGFVAKEVEPVGAMTENGGHGAQVGRATLVGQAIKIYVGLRSII